MKSKRNEDFEGLLQDPELNQEIGPDELAVQTAGLTHPDDLALEQILSEDWDSVPDHEEAPLTPEEALNQFLYENQDDDPIEFNAPTLPLPDMSAETVDAPDYEDVDAYGEQAEYPQEEPEIGRAHV